MKKLIYVFVAVFSVTIILSSCKEHKKEEQIEVKEESTETIKEEVAMAEYQCPMKCEGEKSYSVMGSCPACKMDLKEVKKEDNEDHSDHNH